MKATKREQVVDYHINNTNDDILLEMMGYIEEGKERGLKLLEDKVKNYDAIYERISDGFSFSEIEKEYEYINK